MLEFQSWVVPALDAAAITMVPDTVRASAVTAWEKEATLRAGFH
ncbi:MAG: hypothetical protein ACLPWO_05155 [Thermoplasmata archaeon]